MLQGLLGFVLGLALFATGAWVGGRKKPRHARRRLREWVEENACWECREVFNDQRKGGAA